MRTNADHDVMMKRLCEDRTGRSDEMGYLERPRGGPAWLAEDHLENIGLAVAEGR